MDDLSGILLLGLRIGLAILLYIFLGWGLLIIWRDIKAQGEKLVQRAIPSIELLFADQSKFPGKRRYNLPFVFIGREPGCECLVSDDTVSSRHARLSYRQNQWWVEDLDSRNGTFLNENPVQTPTVLTEGDELRCGQIAFRITIGD